MLGNEQCTGDQGDSSAYCCRIVKPRVEHSQQIAADERKSVETQRLRPIDLCFGA
jgi:hypothetical protein